MTPNAMDQAMAQVERLLPGPSMLIAFTSPGGIQFDARFKPGILESQFEVAGRELIAIAAKMRDSRLTQQMQGALVPASQPAQARPAGPPQPLLIETR